MINHDIKFVNSGSTNLKILPPVHLAADEIVVRVHGRMVVFVQYMEVFRVSNKDLILLDDLGFHPVALKNEKGVSIFSKKAVVVTQYTLLALFKERLYKLEECPDWFVTAMESPPVDIELEQSDLDVEHSIHAARVAETQGPDPYCGVGDLGQHAIFEKINNEVKESIKKHLYKPMNADVALDVTMSAMKSLEAMQDLGQIGASPKVHTTFETWTTMKDCGRIKGLWFKFLNKFIGRSVNSKSLRWYHILIGYKIEARSRITLDPTLILRESDVGIWTELNGMPNDDADTRGVDLHVDELSENACANASYFATIQSPQAYMDFEVTPVMPAKFINLNFTIKK